MQEKTRNMKIFMGNSNCNLAYDIAKELGCEIGKADVTRFSDSEISVQINESVRGEDCFIIQSTSNPVNENLMELLLIIDALKRASAARITAVIPYFGYARQDRKVKPRSPISAKLVADLISSAGADRILTMELHALQIQGFFKIPVDHIISAPFFASFIKQSEYFNPEEFTVLAPDFGAVARARQFAKRLECPLALIDKRRPSPNVSEVMNIIGDVKNKNIVLIDDIIDTAGTICNASEAVVKKAGAKDVYVYSSHAVLSGQAIERLKNNDSIKKAVFLNTINIPKEKMINKFTILNVAPVISEAIKRIHQDTPVSTMILE